jgi:hypothetical protein
LAETTANSVQQGNHSLRNCLFDFATADVDSTPPKPSSKGALILEHDNTSRRCLHLPKDGLAFIQKMEFENSGLGQMTQIHRQPQHHNWGKVFCAFSVFHVPQNRGGAEPPRLPAVLLLLFF